MAVKKGQKRGSYSRSEEKHKKAQTLEISEDGMSYLEISNILNLPIHVIKRIEIDALRKLRMPNSDVNKKLHEYYNIDLKPKETIDL